MAARPGSDRDSGSEGADGSWLRRGGAAGIRGDTPTSYS
jgi:hypothetical protein